MIDIIKRGQIPEDKVYRATCYNCKTVFEFTQKDGRVTDDQRDGRYVSLNCPVCGHLITHNI